MNKKVFTMMITLLLAVVATTASALPAGDVWDGGGISEVTPTDNTYPISNGGQLAWVAQEVNNGNDFDGMTIKLATNINLGNVQWTPIGYNNTFKGTFDGNGYVISNLNANMSNNSSTPLHVGLFGVIGTGGTVKNLGIEVGRGSVSISVSATSSDADEYVGGIAGENWGTISNCYTNLLVGKENDGNLYAGGIAGRNHGNIENCYALGSVAALKYAGGIAGSNSDNASSNGTIQYCYATVSVIGEYAGGITCNGGTVKNCIALNASITSNNNNSSNGGTYRVSNATTKSDNHATACLISGDQGAGNTGGANLTIATFNNVINYTGALTGWNAWNVDNNTNLPTLKDFKATQPAATQPAASITRASVMPLIKIENENDMLKFYQITENGYEYEGETVTLTASINFHPTGFEINNKKAFLGIFDGGGYTINWEGTGSLFAKIGKGNTGSKVKNLGVTRLYALLGDSDLDLGGIAHSNFGTIENCYTTLSLTASGTGNAGGIAANNSGTIENCYTTLSLTASGTGNAGGIAANNSGTIRDCYTTGVITAGGNAGGIAANNSGTIERCYATGAITASGKAGGIAATNSSNVGNVQKCIALNSSIYGTSDATEIGRITGNNSATLLNNYAALSIPGIWEDKGVTTKNGADLTTDNFIGTNSVAQNGAFNDWGNWVFDSNNNLLPTLNGFKTDQPTKDIERAPYLIKPVVIITTQTELEAIKFNLADSYKLGNDITLTGDWTPIGNATTTFKGTFDGQGFVISEMNVSIQDGADAYAGLFGYISGTATVKNLGVTGSVTGRASGSSVHAGGIAGYSTGTITNCYTDVTVDATGRSVYAGGIVGSMVSTTTSNCFTLGNCTATATVTAIAGGIVGYKNGSLSYCYSTRKVESKGDATNKYTGGIVGQNASGTVIGCIALNKDGIIGDAAISYTNRIAGNGSSNITHCYASPAIPSTWSNIGADKQSGADLTTTNFITSNTAFTGDWTTTAGNWTFTDKNFTHLPKLMTTGLTPKKEVGVQTDIKRTDCIGLVQINGEVDYTDDLHEDKYIVISKDGILTVGADDAKVNIIEIEEGGQVITDKELDITKTMTTQRTLANKWITFGTPVKMATASTASAASTYVLTGYATAMADDQTWAKVKALPTTLPANTPYLLAADNAGTTLTITATSTADSPITIAFKKAETNEALNSGIFLFRMNPALCNQTLTNIYVLTSDGTRFELKKTDYVVKPFECYLIANAATRAAVQSLRTGGDLPTGNEQPTLPSDAFRLWGADGQLQLDASQPTDVQIYNLSGSLLHSFRLNGSRTLTLGRGIYLVRSNNITYKVSL